MIVWRAAAHATSGDGVELLGRGRIARARGFDRKQVGVKRQQENVSGHPLRRPREPEEFSQSFRSVADGLNDVGENLGRPLDLAEGGIEGQWAARQDRGSRMHRHGVPARAAASRPRLAAEDVAPERLVDDEILQVLADMRGRLFENRLAKRQRQKFHDEIVGKRRRADEIERRCAKLAGDVGMPEQVPVLAQVFVDEIILVAGLQRLNPRYQRRHHLEHGGLGRRQAVDQRNRFLRGGCAIGVFDFLDATCDMLERHGAEASRLRVVADVDEAAFSHCCDKHWTTPKSGAAKDS